MFAETERIQSTIRRKENLVHGVCCQNCKEQHGREIKMFKQLNNLRNMMNPRSCPTLRNFFPCWSTLTSSIGTPGGTADTMR